MKKNLPALILVGFSIAVIAVLSYRMANALSPVDWSLQIQDGKAGVVSKIDGTPLVTFLTNGNVGIGTGTTDPTQKLSVIGNTYISGNVGIGTTDLNVPLQIYGAGNELLKLVTPGGATMTWKMGERYVNAGEDSYGGSYDISSCRADTCDGNTGAAFYCPESAYIPGCRDVHSPCHRARSVYCYRSSVQFIVSESTDGPLRYGY